MRSLRISQKAGVGHGLTLVFALFSMTSQANTRQCSSLFTPLIPPQGQLSSAAVIDRYRALMSQILSYASMPGDIQWSSRTGGCMTFPAKWAVPLRANGSPVEILGVEYSPISLPGGPSGTLHYFLVDQASASGEEIIIDPTYKQFFKANFPEPDIFIGTRRDLEAVFSKYKNLISFSFEKDQGNTYDPLATVEIIYGYGRGEADSTGKQIRVNRTRQFISQ